ncbi:phosphoglycolate phosphatase 1A, chloroplastic-like isoform X2 [Chelonus insularis]|uniref:phosphoglycolate phosphatase 1A, chloroplastic-like isoform X2 n=1 Tax=Chelonus insularis TaxID=460826 RepID=UPI0015896EA2|nr:phosphoglycolate phosphatase 1A, chloroplastic-like isoform X2 [Chelonus insularis]
MKPKDISQLTIEEFKTFLDSFDTIMTDCDGVLWLGEVPIKGALEALKLLDRFGKKVLFVSNNNTRSIEDYLQKFQVIGYKATPDQIMLPCQAIVWYLHHIGFKGKAFVVGSKAFIQALSDAGIDIVLGPKYVDENMDVIHNALRREPEIKAVIFDFDINLNWVKMIQVAALLKRDDVLFFTGPRDKRLPISKTISLIGPGNFVDILINYTGRQPIEFAKPSEILKKILIKRYAISNPERCIFVGDSLVADMKFAELCGFQKFWGCCYL